MGIGKNISYGKDDNTRVGFPLTIENDGNKYYDYEASEDSDNEGNVIYTHPLCIIDLLFGKVISLLIEPLYFILHVPFTLSSYIFKEVISP